MSPGSFRNNEVDPGPSRGGHRPSRGAAELRVVALVALGLAILVLSTPHRIWPDDNAQKPGGGAASKAKIVMPRYLQSGKHAPISLEDAAGQKVSSPFAWRVTHGTGLVLLSDPPAPQGAFKAGTPPPQPIWDLSALAAGDVTVVATDTTTTTTTTTGDTGGIISDPGIIKIVSITIAPDNTVTEGQPTQYRITVSPADLPMAYDDWTLTASTGEVFGKGRLAAADFLISSDNSYRSATFTATLPLGTAGRSDIFVHSTLAMNDPVVGLVFMDADSAPLVVAPVTVVLTARLAIKPASPVADSPIGISVAGEAPDLGAVSASYSVSQDGVVLAQGMFPPVIVAGTNYVTTLNWTPPLSLANSTVLIQATATDGISFATAQVGVWIASPPPPATTVTLGTVPATVTEDVRTTVDFTITPASVLPFLQGIKYKVWIAGVTYVAYYGYPIGNLRIFPDRLEGTLDFSIPRGTVTGPMDATLAIGVDISGGVSPTADARFTVLPAYPPPPPKAALDILTPGPILRREGLPLDVNFTLFPKEATASLKALTLSIYDADTKAQIAHANLDTAAWTPTDDHAMYAANFTVPDGVSEMAGGTGRGRLVVEASDATGVIASATADFTGVPGVTLTLVPSGDVLVEGVEEVIGVTISPRIKFPTLDLTLAKASGELILKRRVGSASFVDDFDPFGNPIQTAVIRGTIPPGTVAVETPVVLSVMALEGGVPVLANPVEVRYLLRPANVSKVPELLSVTPASALPLAEVVFAGRNFRSIPDENTVTFTRGDQTVELLPLVGSADGRTLTVSVPPRIGEGGCEIRVRTADGESNAIPFTVLGSAAAVSGITQGIAAVLAVPGLKAPIKQELREAQKFVDRFVAQQATERDPRRLAKTLDQALEHLAMSIRALAGKPEASALLEVGRQLVAARALLIGSPILEEETMAILEFLAQPGMQPRAATALLSALGGIDKAIDAYLLDWEVGVMDGILEMMYRLEDAEKYGVPTKATRKRTTKKLIDKWTKIKNGYIQAGGAGIGMIVQLGTTLSGATKTYDQCGSTKAVEGIKKDFIDKFYPPNPPTVPVTGPPGMPGGMKSKCEIFDDQVFPGDPIGGVATAAQVFTSRENDSESGLMHYRARWYDPRTGRFGQRDPLHPVFEHYLYARNNPLIYTDPMGLEPGDWWDPRSYDFGWAAKDIGRGFETSAQVAVEIPSAIGSTFASGEARDSFYGFDDAVVEDLSLGALKSSRQVEFQEAYEGGRTVGHATVFVENAVLTVSGVQGIVTGVRALAGGVQLARLAVAGGGSVEIVLVGGEAEVLTAALAAKLGLTAYSVAAGGNGASGAGNAGSAPPSAGGGAVPGSPPKGITQSAKALGHVMQRHVPGGSLTGGKSLFSVGESVPDLIRAAETTPRTLQAGGNFERIVDAGRVIGTDRATGQATSLYTVIHP